MPCGDASASIRFYAAEASVSCGTRVCEPPFIRFCAGSEEHENDFGDGENDFCDDVNDSGSAHDSPSFPSSEMISTMAATADTTVTRMLIIDLVSILFSFRISTEFGSVNSRVSCGFDQARIRMSMSM